MRPTIPQLIALALAGMAGAGVAAFALTPINSTLRSDVLGFAGNMIGPGAGALVAYLVVVLQERRTMVRQFGQVRNVTVWMNRALAQLIDADKQNSAVNRQSAVEQIYRLTTAASKIDIDAVPDFVTYTALGDLIEYLEGSRKWAITSAEMQPPKINGRAPRIFVDFCGQVAQRIDLVEQALG